MYVSVSTYVCAMFIQVCVFTCRGQYTTVGDILGTESLTGQQTWGFLCFCFITGIPSIHNSIQLSVLSPVLKGEHFGSCLKASSLPSSQLHVHIFDIQTVAVNVRFHTGPWKFTPTVCLSDKAFSFLLSIMADLHCTGLVYKQWVPTKVKLG